MEGNLGRKLKTPKEIREAKMVEFFGANKEFSEAYILNPLKFVRKITGIEAANKKQSIKDSKENVMITSLLESKKPLNKSSISILMNKLDSDKSSPDLRKKVIEKLKSDQKKLKEQSMSVSMSVLSPSKARMSPSAKSSASSKKSSVSAKSSASSKKSSVSSKSSASSKKSYEANEYLPVMRYKTSYI